MTIGGWGKEGGWGRKNREHTACNWLRRKNNCSKITFRECGQILRCFFSIAEINITRQVCILAWMLDLISCSNERHGNGNLCRYQCTKLKNTPLVNTIKYNILHLSKVMQAALQKIIQPFLGRQWPRVYTDWACRLFFQMRLSRDLNTLSYSHLRIYTILKNTANQCQINDGLLNKDDSYVFFEYKSLL